MDAEGHQPQRLRAQEREARRHHHDRPPRDVWTVTGAAPTANELGNNKVIWNDIGPIDPGKSKEVSINVKVGDTSGSGKFIDKAVATGVCGPASGTAGAGAAVGVPVEARCHLELPRSQRRARRPPAS